MLAMRPATPEDQSRLALMIQARSDWMKDKQLPSWRSWGKHVHELAGNCTRHPSEMWVLTEDDRILGCTTVLRTAAPWTWTADEAAETAYYLNGTVTDPAVRHRKLGTLIADWAVDHAARAGISHVRRDCSSAALAAYYQQQNFRLIRSVATLGGHTTYALERKAERVPSLAGWLITSESSAVISRSLRNALSGAARSNAAEARRLFTNSLRRPAEAPAII
ncbi:GNAT family N-acetyltransferase [Streptomyces turgidiscabies]|uniref:N-acetyltransferase domain-containing protein n=1 Tax=Streptomyces turgidiscabies (strain Car8) TaxID=698760 RepID=L7F2W4_STRT8|nr:GNAT family N-acetyltransferase [Streptomyces turgidiscabies]ELP65958.1 hypothetical protein STRTUCAR8_01866 [Streptomyces turgidiscabies Car8]MDX3498276.1 GNAT family N-acetyltransferase [Streptomyces turgidiscabies]GAQ74420.1 hypothetical protein T45_06195 [Streptomyces turgidiscabies]